MAEKDAHCIKVLRETFPQISSNSEAKRVIKVYRSYQNQGLVGDEIIEQARKDTLEDILEKAREFRREKLNQAAIRSGVRYVLGAKTRKGSFVPLQGLRARIFGSLHGFQGSVDSAYNKFRVLISDDLNYFEANVSKENLTLLGKDKTLQRNVAREMFELDRLDGAVGSTKDKRAISIAKVFHHIRLRGLTRANRAGAYIAPRQDHLITVNHDARKMSRGGTTEDGRTTVGGLAEWKETIYPLLHKQYLQETANIDAALNAAYRAIIKGQFVTHAAQDLDVKLSGVRKLRFKDVDSQLKYQKLYGKGSLLDGFLHQVDSRARSIALMETFGPSYRENVQSIVADVQSVVTRRIVSVGETSKEGKRLIRELENMSPARVDRWMAEVDGRANIPENNLVATVGSSLRSLAVMSKLGSAMLSSFPDLGNLVSQLHYQGKPLISAWSEVLGSIFKGKSNKEMKEIAGAIKLYSEVQAGTSGGRYFVDGDRLGEGPKWSRLMFRLNLLDWWNDKNRMAFAAASAKQLADNRRKSYRSISPKLRNVLQQSNILEPEWELYRKYAVEKSDSGAYFMTTERIDKIPDTMLLGYLQQVQRRNKVRGAPPKKLTSDLRLKARDILHSRLFGFYVAGADNAIVTPGASGRVFLTGGTVAGTHLGEIARLFAQFKGFPVEHFRRNVLSKHFLATHNGSPTALALAHQVLAATMFGYFALYSKSILRGQIIPVFSNDAKQNSRIFLTSMIQGGGLGIYGDFLFGEYDKYGRTFLQAIAGPTLGQIDPIASIATGLRRLEVPGVTALRQAASNVPFANLFYTTAAFNYLLMYSMYEMIDPGYLKRMEKRMENNYGRKFYIRPSRHASILGIRP